MRGVPRLLMTVGLMTALAGCGSGQAPSKDLQPTPDAQAATETAGDDQPGDEGATAQDEIYGPGCGDLPDSGAGSVAAMSGVPAGTAAVDNPMLTTLAEALREAGLVDALNDTGKSYTVFAPADSAFAALPAGALDQLMADKDRLADVLDYHLVPQRYDAEGLAVAREVTTLHGERLAISGDQGSLSIDEQEQATPLCANIPTANATVFIVDKVLMPPQ